MFKKYQVGIYFASRDTELNIVAYGDTQEEADEKLKNAIKRYDDEKYCHFGKRISGIEVTISQSQ